MREANESGERILFKGEREFELRITMRDEGIPGVLTAAPGLYLRDGRDITAHVRSFKHVMSNNLEFERDMTLHISMSRSRVDHLELCLGDVEGYDGPFCVPAYSLEMRKVTIRNVDFRLPEDEGVV